MSSVAPSGASSPPDPQLFAERMARADGCPECVVNLEVPQKIFTDAPEGWSAYYLCSWCGEAWTTSWSDA